jgi:hypothetical protein
VNRKAFLPIRSAVLFLIVMACAFCGSNLNFNMDNDVSHRSHGSPFRLLLGERRSDLLNKSIINRVESCIENLAYRYHAT